MLITAIFFVAWDIIFTHLGVWYFNPLMITGIHVGNLPLEEILFFFAIPYSCVFLYETLSWKIRNENISGYGTVAFYSILIFLSVSLLFNYDKIYTLICFGMLLVYMVYLKFFGKPGFLNTALLAYTILLIPFMIVNGYLTGMFTPDAVVKYNNEENMGIRLITIPVEDTFYGFFLFLMNVHLYELFKKSLNRN
jgi:lycopene cyclase domain-containing protein